MIQIPRPLEGDLKLQAERIGRRVRRLRQDRTGLSQEKFAAKAGATFGSVNAIELGRQMPSIPMLQDIAEALGEPVTVFFLSDEDFETRMTSVANECLQQLRSDLRKDIVRIPEYTGKRQVARRSPARA